MTVEEISQKYDVDIKAKLGHSYNLSDKDLIVVRTPDNLCLSQVGINKLVPDVKTFVVFKYKPPNVRRVMLLLLCTFKNCGKIFRKWHNFFDHLMIHSNYRPYVCPVQGCGQGFTQKANLNKHLEIHSGNKRFTCELCQKGFYTKFNLKVGDAMIDF